MPSAPVAGPVTIAVAELGAPLFGTARAAAGSWLGNIKVWGCGAAVGTFYEGVMTSGYPSDATENSVQANITAAGYR